MKKFIAELARNGRHFKKTFKGETEYEARMAVNEYLSEHTNTEFWNFTEAPTMKQPSPAVALSQWWSRLSRNGRQNKPPRTLPE